MSLLSGNFFAANYPRMISLFFALLFAVFGLGKLYAEEDHEKNENHEEHEGEEGHIALTDEQLAMANISLEKAAPASIRESLPFYGVVTINSERVQVVSARFPGVIKNLYHKVGDQVKAGDSLAFIESNESLKPYTLTSSQNGVIIERAANIGEQTGDRTLFVVANLSTVWVELSVFPKDMSKIRVGQSVRVSHPQSGVRGDGKLVYLSPSANSINQTVTARVLLDNSSHQWFSGLYVNAEATLSKKTVEIAVKNDAIQTVENKSVIFVRGKEGFEPRPVRLGKSDSEYTEVLDGVSLNDTYAARNSFILKSDLGKEGAEHGH
jgi:cobalt-zinc-cadmium efflux system membrane fusion protein